jgi:hypothetical protein
MITIIGIYLFIVIGFIAKKKFPEIHEKSFVIMSVYFLQPFLTLWGLMLKPINLSTTNAPISYLSVIFISFIFTPVIIPGDMGRYSYLLVGQPASMEKSFGTSCHGAGRVMSRAQAKKYVKSIGGVETYIKQKGLKVVARGKGTIMEEIPEAYKDVTEVIKVIAGVGIAKPILKLKPLGTLKG